MRGVPGFKGERLRQAREARRKSVASLAEALEVSQQAVYKWESTGAPRAELLPRLAEIVGVPPSYFFRDAPVVEGATFFRSRLSATKAGRAGARARLAWLSEATIAVERAVELPPLSLPVFDVPPALELSDERVIEIAHQARKFFGLGEAPISSVVGLLESHGVVVSRMSLGEGRLDAFSHRCGAHAFVFLNADKKTAVRSRFDAAHELGHLLLHAGISPEFLDDAALHARVEKQADRFAGAFLLPDSFVRELSLPITVDSLLALKPRWGASVGAMLSRCKQLSLIGDGTAHWFVMGRRGWRTHEPLDDVLTPEKPTLLRQAFELAREHGLRPERDLALPLRDVEALAGLAEGFLEPPTATPRVVLRAKEAPTQNP
jgi:Zn-dependent peptidase ImmA (M78 family)/transcriptional regulator with XRE-family HTH domain